MRRSLLSLVLTLTLVVGLPSLAESGYFDKCTQTEDSLMTGEEMDWLRVPVPDSSQAGVSSNTAPQQAQTATPVPAAGSHQRGYAYHQPTYFVQPAGNPAVYRAPVQYLQQTGASPAATCAVQAVPGSSAYGAYQAFPVYAPGMVHRQVMQPVPGGYYPIIIIQQQPPAQPAAQTQPQTPAQPQTLSQAITQALTQAQGTKGQAQAGAADPQATKPGFKGFVNAFLGAGSTVFPNGYTGGGLMLARPVLDLLLNTF